MVHIVQKLFIHGPFQGTILYLGSYNFIYLCSQSNISQSIPYPLSMINLHLFAAYDTSHLVHAIPKIMICYSK